MLESLGELLPAAARRFGDRTALVFGEREFSFRELDKLSNALAPSLVKFGRPAARQAATKQRPSPSTFPGGCC